MLEQLKIYAKSPIFPADEDKTFTASLLHVILWSLLVGVSLYTLTASVFAIIQPHMLLIAWLYVIALGALAVILMVVMRRGYVGFAAIAVNVGFWIILTVAAYFNGGVAAPAYSGYLIVIVSTCLLVGWQWGLVAAVASTVSGLFFLQAPLPEWDATYSYWAVWSANVAYFFVATMLLALALRAIKHASQQTRREMSERLKTEEALSHSEQRFRAIFDAVNDAIFVQELGAGRILEVNQKMCEMYGYTAEEARHLLVGDFSSGSTPYTQQEAMAWIQKAASGAPQIFEWLSKDRAGRLFWVEVNMRRAVIDGQDRLLVVVRDIDDRKRAEATLRREQAYYEAIVNATPVMLWLKDTENRTLHLNPAAASLEGLEAAEVEGRSAYELYPRVQAEAYYRDDLEVIQSGQPKLGIIEQHTAAGTGKVMWVETGKVPVRDEQGNIVGVLACAVDITARKEAELVQAATRQIAEAALMTPTLEEFYQAVYAIVSPLIPASNFYIALYDAANDQFTVPYLVDEFDRVWPPYRPGKGLNAHVMRSGEPLLATPAVFAELEQQGKAEIINRRMVEWLGVPLKTPQGLLGVMAVQNYAGPARLSEKHMDLLVFVSAQVAMTIERKRATERERRVSQGLRAVIEAAQELIACADLDTLHRRSVELAREKLGLERCGLYLLDEREEFILGTFGTDDQGQTIDERQARHPVHERPELLSLSDQLWFAFASVPSYWHENHVQWLEGKGWNVATPIRSRWRTVGVLYNDAAITHTPLDEAQQDMAAVYCSLLGSLFELKRAEADLANERDLLQLLMDNFPDTIYFKDAASRFTRINQAQARMLGIARPEEAIGKTDADFFQNSELNQMFLAEEQRLMTSGEPIIDRLEYNPTLEGRPRWLSASKVPLRDASGRIVGMVGISRDITDRILAEQREKTNSQGLRAVIEAAQELIACADLDAVYRRSVELAREKLGLERCGLFLLDDQGQQLMGTYGTDDQGQTTDEHQARDVVSPVQHSELFAAPDRLWTVHDGPLTYWQGNAAEVLSPAGWMAATPIRSRQHNIGVLYNDTAITHRPLDETRQEVVAVYCSLLGSLIELKRAEDQLAHERDLLQSLMDNIPDAIYFKDAASRFTHINQAMARILGLQASPEAVGKTDADFFSNEMDQLYLAEEQQLLRTGEPIIDRLEYNPTADGRARWFSASKVPLRDGSGHIVGMVGISRDITDRMWAEQREKTISQGLRAVIEATQELMDCADVDTLYRRSVELAREKLGLERCGLHLLSEDQQYLLGTYGTDERGQTTDERQECTPSAERREVFTVPDRLWTILDKPFTYWEAGVTHTLPGAGWIAATPIRSRHQNIGMMYNDTAITYAPLDKAQQEVVAVYCSLLGSLIELKRTETELAHERDLLQALMANIPDLIYFKDTASRFTRVNWAQARILGLVVPEEALGRTDLDFFDPQLAQTFLAEEQELIRTGQPIIDRVEYHPASDGQPRWLTATKVPLRDALGQIYGIAGISRDVTERTLAQRRDQTMSRGLRAVIETVDELMKCADLDVLYRRAVELAREKLEMERCGLFLLDEQGWLCGTYGTDEQRQTTDERGAHFPPVNWEIFETASNQLWAVGESEQTYWNATRQKVVGTGWVGTTFIRMRDRVVGVLYNDTAITRAPVDEAQQEVLAVYCSLLGSLIELKRAEAALRESEALYRQAIEAAGAVPYYLDYPTESYRFMGDGVRELTGLSAAEMHPSSWDTLMQEVYPLGQSAEMSWRQAVQETRQGHITVWRADYYVLTRDGRYCWVTDASVQVLDEQGRPRGAIGILQDITERKQVELALRESEATTRALLEAIPDAFFRFDANGIFKEYIPSKEFASLLPPSEFIGEPFAAVLPPDVAQQLDLNFRQVLERGELRSYEYPLLIGAETRYFEARLVKMTQDDVLGMVRDVTDRKRAELALQQREAHLRSILDNFPYLVWLKDVDGHFLAVNKVFAQACGQPSIEAVIGKTDLDVWPRELAERYRADDRAVMASSQKQASEEIISEQGTETWFETFKSPVFDARGQIIGTTGFSHDITARRQAEAAIRESETLFRQLADNAPAFIAMNDETGLTTYLNRAWREFRGNEPALPLEEWAERIHPDDRRRYAHEFRSSLQGQRKFTTEYRLRRTDGQYRWLLDTVVPRYAADERFAGFIGIAIDITDRKNAEEALRRSEGRLRLITDNMADSISQVDAQQRLVYASPSAERVYGHSLRDLLGRPLYDFVHPEDSARLYHQVVMAIELRVPSLRLEYRYRHAAGHYLWVESEMRLLYDERGDFTGGVFGSRDISARKQIEGEREDLIKELEDKNAELERFTYTVSHDLKSPLITIRGFLGFLEKDAATGNLDRLRADITRIAEATTRMQRLLDELLELSRVGRMGNLPEEVAFGLIAQEAVELVHGRIMARGVQVELADDLPVVYVDRTRLVEAVQNLVDNAVKFMGDQPEPRIIIGALGTERAGLPIFFVEDNGLGIEPEYHERIFGLFNKLDATSEGTGVGLALVKRIIDLHGGYIWVESEGEGRGSTFFFTLPRPASTARDS